MQLSFKTQTVWLSCNPIDFRKSIDGLCEIIQNEFDLLPHQGILISEYIHQGEVEIDNNGVENKVRPFALGRKNCLFVGNQRDANAGALFYSLIETCVMNDVNPRTYLRKLFELAPEVRRGERKAKELLPQYLKTSL